MIPKERKYSKVWYLVGLLVAGNLAVWSAVFASASVDYVRFVALDIGQGDALYFRTPGGADVLVDGGPGDSVLSKLGDVMPLGDRTIQFVILTHPHADHVAGLVEVLKRYEVKEIMFAEVEYTSATYVKFLDLVGEKNIRIVRPALGQRIFLDEATVLDILYPVSGRFEKAPKDINDSSIVARLSLGQSQVLLTGDAGKDIEEFLLRAGLPLESEILKVGHHGSRHSTGAEFVERVSP